VIVVISDVHLGLEECNQKDFERFISTFLERKDIECLILLGDILDFWRRPPVDVILDNLHILNRLNELDTKIYYIIGNHDYSLGSIKSKTLQFEFAQNLVLESGGRKFRFIHGHQIEYADWLYLYEKLSLELCTTDSEMTTIQAGTWDFYQKAKSFTKHGVWKPLLQKGAIYAEKLRDLDNLSDEQLRNMADSIVTPLKDRTTSLKKRRKNSKKNQKSALRPDEYVRNVADSIVTPLKDRTTSLKKRRKNSKKNQKSARAFDEYVRNMADSIVTPLKERTILRDDTSPLRPDELLGRIVKSILVPPEDRRKSLSHKKRVTATERSVAEKSAGLADDEFLVYGHTHEPFVRKDVANAGSWVSDAERSNTYLIIQNGKVKLQSR
jgi:UDP-2,3-diacylglucosamine pyrophosphatase LpxH